MHLTSSDVISSHVSTTRITGQVRGREWRFIASYKATRILHSPYSILHTTTVGLSDFSSSSNDLPSSHNNPWRMTRWSQRIQTLWRLSYNSSQDRNPSSQVITIYDKALIRLVMWTKSPKSTLKKGRGNPMNKTQSSTSALQFATKQSLNYSDRIWKRVNNFLSDYRKLQ